MIEILQRGATARATKPAQVFTRARLFRMITSRQPELLGVMSTFSGGTFFPRATGSDDAESTGAASAKPRTTKEGRCPIVPP